MSQYHLWPTIYSSYLGMRPIIIIIGSINLLEYDDNIFIAQSRTNVQFYMVSSFEFHLARESIK